MERKNSDNKIIELEDGSGGEKSSQLIQEIRQILKFQQNWGHLDDDGAVFEWNKKKIAFTTDAFIVDPLFFPGGDIGKIAVCGTINDLAMMGAQPIGISLSLVIEEGFLKKDFRKIIHSINKITKESKVPIVTGDTKVMERGKLDKIEITTAGIGVAEHILPNTGARPGDLVVVSGDLGEHGAAILASRFNYSTKIKSDCRPLHREIKAVGKFLNCAKDPTRGGSAAILNEISEKSRVKIILEEKSLPFKREVAAIADLLGIDRFALPSEGRFIATLSPRWEKKVISLLKKFNREAKIIGRVEKGEGVYLKTSLGSLRRINLPESKLIPRIC